MTTRLNVRWGAKPRRPRCPSFSPWETHWFTGRFTVLRSKRLRRKTQTLSSYTPRKDHLGDRALTADPTTPTICSSLSRLSPPQLPDRLKNRCRSVSGSVLQHSAASSAAAQTTKLLLSPAGFSLSIKECTRETLSVRSRCPVTQAAWDRGLPPPPKMR